MTRTTALLVILCCLLGCRERSSRKPKGGKPLALPVISELPDPFRFKSGKRVKTRGEWPRRRGEIKKTLETYQFGTMPPCPGKPPVAKELSRETVFDGTATRRLIRVATAGLSLHVGLTRSTSGEGPSPAIVHIDHRGPFKVAAREIVERGYMLVDYDPTFLDPDEKGMVGPAQAAYPEHDWATLAVWAWGAMRVADYLLTLGHVDSTRLLVTGHSRSGKAALLAGALDRRFAVVAPQGSGCGGMASYRHVADKAEDLDHITRTFPHWFHRRLRRFAGEVRRLPFDQHFLAALVAPRALISIDAFGDLWASPRATQQTHLAALQVYRFLGAEGRLGIHFRPGRHELSAADWRTLLDFADHVFSGKKEQRFDRLPFPTDRARFSWSAP